MNAATRLADVPLPPRDRPHKTAAHKPPDSPLSLREIIEAHLDRMDPVTKSWAQLIAPLIAHLTRALRIEPHNTIDWIYAAEKPLNVFEFSDWAHSKDRQ